jgi:DNA modification methylase
VYDPFAGGSVRGIVAAKLGRRYYGVDLRPEQAAANEEQAARICPDNAPVWVVGDACDTLAFAEAESIPGECDLVFSCPPYASLERYSDDPRDISTMDYDDFLTAYRQIIADACRLLKQDRFACFVVGDVRDPKNHGIYRNFIGDTVDAFEAAGLGLYNEMILVTAVGSLPIRVGRQFSAYRKVGKTHQQCLVFIKGDPGKAVKACGTVEVTDLSELLPENAEEGLVDE